MVKQDASQVFELSDCGYNLIVLELYVILTEICILEKEMYFKNIWAEKTHSIIGNYRFRI